MAEVKKYAAIAEKRGEISGELRLLEKLHKEGILNEEQYQSKTKPLRKKLKGLEQAD